MHINYKKSKPTGAEALGVIIGGAIAGGIIATAFALVFAWPVMVLLGVFASLTGFPTAISFWATFVAILILRLASGAAGLQIDGGSK